MPSLAEMATTSKEQTELPSLSEMATRKKPDVGSELYPEPVLLPRERRGFYRLLSGIMRDENEIDDFLPLEERHQFGKVVGLMENPQETRDKLANSLYFAVQLDQPPATINKYYDQFVNTKWPTIRPSPRSVRKFLADEQIGQDYIEWSEDEYEPPVIDGAGKLGYIGRIRQAGEKFHPDETITDRASRLIGVILDPIVSVTHGAGARIQYLNLKLASGLTFGADDILSAAIHRINPDLLEGRTIEQATLEAADYNPTKFMKTVGGLVEFLGRLRTGRAIGTQIGLLAKPAELPLDIGLVGKALEAMKLGLISGSGKEITAQLAETIEPGRDYGSEGAIGPIKESAVLATFSLVNSLVLTPALSKVAGTATGQKIIAAADRQIAHISMRYPRTMDFLRKTPSEETLKRFEGGLWRPVKNIETGIIREMKIPFAQLSKTEQALIRHCARAIDTYHKRLYQAYMRKPAVPDIIARKPTVGAPLALPGEVAKAPTIAPEAITPTEPTPVAPKVPKIIPIEKLGIAKPGTDVFIGSENTVGRIPTIQDLKAAETPHQIQKSGDVIYPYRTRGKEVRIPVRHFKEGTEVIRFYEPSDLINARVAPEIAPAKPAPAAEGKVSEPWGMTKKEFDNTFMFHGTPDFKARKVSKEGIKKGSYFANTAEETKGFIGETWHEQDKGTIYGVAKNKIKEGVPLKEDVFGQEWVGRGLAKVSKNRIKPDFEISASDRDNPHRAIIKQALSEGKPVPSEVLEEYKTEKWAQEALAKPAEAVEEEIIKDLTDKTRKRLIKETTEAIQKHDLYQTTLAAAEEMERDIGPGLYYVEPQIKSEVLAITGKVGQKGYKAALARSFTFTDKTATGWDVAAAQAGYEDIDITEFVGKVDRAIEARKKVGVLNEQALNQALASGDLDFELLAMKQEMLSQGFSAVEINDTIREWAKDNNITEAEIESDLVPVEEVKYVEEKPPVLREVEKKARKAKARLSPEQAAITKAREIAFKKKEARYVYEKDGKFHVTQKAPSNLPHYIVTPPKPPAITGTVKHIGPKPEEAATKQQKARAHIIAKQKRLLSEKGHPTQNYRRLAKAMTGKNTMTMMTQEEADYFISSLEGVVERQGRPPKIPTSKDIITKELADKIGKFRDIGILEKFRPAWRVFEKIGLTKEVFEPAFEAEVKTTEELLTFRKKAKEMQKTVGRDKATAAKLFRAIENPGSVKLTPNEQKVVNWGKKFFDDWADRLELPEDKRRKDYITHTFEKAIAETLKTKYPLDPELVRALDFITPKTVFNPYLQERLGKTVGVKEDFWSALEAYENKALKTFYYEPLIQRIRVYQKFLPPNAARYLREYIARITNRPLIIDREVNQTLKEFASEIEKLPNGEELANYLRTGNAAGIMAYNLTGIYYECWLGLRPASAIKNLSQHGLMFAEVGPVAFSKALATTGDKRAKLLNESLVLKGRKFGFLPGIDQTFIKSMESKRRAITIALFKMADRQNVSDAFLAGYYEAEAKGLPRRWCLKRGDEVAKKTQYLYTKLASSQFAQTSPGRVLGVLTTWPENWAELMNDWIRGKPSEVYADYESATGKKLEPTDWIARRKSLWIYLSMVSLAMLIHKKTPFKALYYTGWTSIGALADMASGKLAGLRLPAMIINLVAGIATGDKKRIKKSWNEAKNFIVILKELKQILTGEKDWINLFIYMEKPKKKPTVSKIERKD